MYFPYDQQMRPVKNYMLSTHNCFQNMRKNTSNIFTAFSGAGKKNVNNVPNVVFSINLIMFFFKIGFELTYISKHIIIRAYMYVLNYFTVSVKIFCTIFIHVNPMNII